MGARHLPIVCLRFLTLSAFLLSLNMAQELSTGPTSLSSSPSTSVSPRHRTSQTVDTTTLQETVSSFTDSLCGTEVTLEDGQAVRFKSHGFPSHYPNFSFCSWKINAPEDGELLLQCGVFVLQPCSLVGDALYVSTDYFWLINRYCGESGPMTPHRAKSYFRFFFWSFYTDHPADEVVGFDCTVRAQRQGDVTMPEEADTFRDCGRVNRPPQTSARVARSLGHGKNKLTSSRKLSVAESKNTNSTAPNEIQDGERPLALRVIGGEETFPNEYPWLAALILSVSLGTYPFCGASLIGSKWVLTAAHCMQEAHEKRFNYMVLLGAHDIGSIIETLSHHVHATIKKKIIHPEFNNKTMENDIGLLELEESLTFSDTIRPICLPSGPGSYSGISATVSGWGVTSVNSQRTSSVLLSADLEVMSNFRCHLSYFFYITDTMLCARARGKDACQGDSGGPLAVRLGDLREEMQRRTARALERRIKDSKEEKDEDDGAFLGDDDLDRMVQIGIVSWGNGCAKYSYPGVYTRLDQYLNWIVYYLGEKEACYV